MTNSKEKKMIRIFWEDAVIYDKSSSFKLDLRKRIIEGEVFKEEKDFIIVKNPTTMDYDRSLKRYVPFITKRKITFFFIPTGMISKKELIKPKT